MKIAALNLILRGLAISGRFIVLVGIGKYLSEAELGIYGLFHTTVILALYFIGFDFYTYNTREIIAANINARLHMIRDQFIFHFLTYVIAMPILLLVFFYDFIPLNYLSWFYLILIFEHVSQEFYRIFTALSKSVFANFTAFIRAGLWVYVLAIFWILEYRSFINLQTIFIFWIIGALTSVIISILYLKILNLGTLKKVPVDWVWIKKGILIALPFFISSLCYKIIEYSNRYFIDYFHGKELVGIFTLLSGIANVVNVIVFTTVIMIAYPALYQAVVDKNLHGYSRKVRSFKFRVPVVSVLAGIIMAVLIHPLLLIIDKYPLYHPHFNAFYLLVGANILLNISLIPHYILYIWKKDVLLMKITLAGIVFNILLNIILIKFFDITGAAFSMLFSFILIFILKWYFQNNQEISLFKGT
jgi:O-antigen/teichoic acid export membrane protein